MKGKSIYLMVLVLLLSSIACSLTGGSAGDAADPAEAEQQETPVDGSDAAQAGESQADISAALDQLGEVFESPMGGFSFRQVQGYEALDFFGMVAMAPPGVDQNTGPVITLIGVPNESSLDVQGLMDEMLSSTTAEADVQIGEAYAVTVGGTDGLAADFSGSKDGASVAGRFVVAAPSNGQAFNLIAVFPADGYDTGQMALLDAVLSTVQFFEPESVDLGEGWEAVGEGEGEGWETGSGEMMRQWAASATASSEYGSSDWSAAQAAGAPDTPDCGDYNTSWASADGYGVEWLELDYATPVVPDEINIYQTYSPNQVVKVEVRSAADGSYETVYLDVAYVTECPYLLTVYTSSVDYPVDGVRINLDQSVLEMAWNEIDAVELVGYTP